MIEEAMIAANICAAKFLEKHSRSLLYRIHEEPQEDKLNTAQEVLQSNEFNKLPAAKLINSLAQKYFNNPLSSILILQTLPRAIYSIENKGHFGLGLEHYAHFTSPIRRYPDLILHRLILAVIRKQKSPYSEEELKNIADISSKNEKNAAVSDIKKQVASLSIDIAEKLLKEKLSDDNKQMQIVEELLKDVKLK